MVLLFSVNNVLLGAKGDKESEKGASKTEAQPACCPAHESEGSCPTGADKDDTKKTAATCAGETEKDCCGKCANAKAGNAVVTVNGTKITESDVEKEVGERAKAQFARQGMSDQIKPGL